MSKYLTVAQVAKLKGCTERTIRRLIDTKKLIARENSCSRVNPYLIPMLSLPADLQRKYYKSLSAGEAPVEEKPPDKPSKPLDQYTEAERERISLWITLIKQWQALREISGDKGELDELFIANVRKQYPELEISLRTLYRKYKAYIENDFDGLIECRGGWNKGSSGMPASILDAFMWFYLDERQPTISQCYRATLEWARKFNPDDIPRIPNERTFRRHAAALPEAVTTLCRKGEKALKDKHCPYIERMYDDLEANDVWVADNHTFDFITVGEHGKKHRLYLTAFIDVKSGVIVGFNITENPSSHSTLLALRDAILKHGLPKTIYVDNGSEFLTHDIGGRGHRRRKNWNKDDRPPTILNTLGINMRNAQVCNAKAKPIERTFGTLKNQISRMISSFCGGDIKERPESLKKLLKRGELPTDDFIRQSISTLISGSFNMDSYGGSERRYQGKSRIDVWNESIKRTTFRKAAAEDLNLLLARISRYQKIGRKGVYAEFLNTKLWYTRPEFWRHQGTEVYIRYDPTDAREVCVYSRAEDKYMFNCYLDEALTVDFLTENLEDIAEAERVKNKVLKSIKDYKKGILDNLSPEKRIDMLTLEIEKALRNLEDGSRIEHPTTFTPVMSDKVKRENPQIAEIIEVNWAVVNNNTKIRTGKE
jgi:hypothetical protein